MQNIVPDSSSHICGYTTRESHLKRLGKNEETAWNEFYTKYKAMIYAIGTARQLSSEECEDLMQEVAIICSRKLQNFVYDPERCRFRSFLFKITTNVAFNLLRKKTKNQAEELKDDYSVVPELDIQFMQEYERFLLERSFLILKNSISSESYLAFDMLFRRKQEHDGASVLSDSEKAMLRRSSGEESVRSVRGGERIQENNRQKDWVFGTKNGRYL